MSADDKDEELLRRARELAEKARPDRSGRRGSAAERLARDNRLFRWLNNAASRLKDVLGPLGTLLGWLLGLVAKWLQWAAVEPADPDAPGGGTEARISPARFVRSIAISGLVLVALHVTWSAIYYYGTYFEETVYVTGKQEIATGEL